MRVTETTVLKVFGLIAIVSLLLIICAPSYGQSTQVRSLSIVEPTPAPINVRASPSGTGGQRTYFYWVVANYFAGSSVPFGPAQVRAANPLTGTNGVSISWDASPDAISYDVLRADTKQSPVANGPCAACAVATGVVVTSVNDTGGALAGYTLPAQIPVGQALGSITNTNAIPPRLNWTTDGPYTFRMDKNTWTVVGVDVLANRPAQCVGGHDAYICLGAGCPGSKELQYCVTNNNWDTIGTSGGTAAFWNVVGVGVLAARPALCTALQDVYLCSGAGCGVDPEFLEAFYCTATNTWSSLAAGGDSLQFFNVINEGPIINLPATCTVGDVFICKGNGCKGTGQLEIYVCTAINTFTALPGAQVTQYVYYQAGGCQIGVAASGFNMPGANFPAPTCVTFDTDKVAGFVGFDATNDESVFGHFQLPTNWTGTLDLQLYWFATATTGNAIWSVQTQCLGANEQYSDITWNPVGIATVAPAGVSNDFVVSDITSVDVTGCLGGETLFWWFYRDANAGGDTMAGDGNLVSLRYAFSEAQ